MSQQAGNLVLFPAIKKSSVRNSMITSGTSCGHQILDATHKKALHPIELLRSMLNDVVFGFSLVLRATIYRKKGK